MPRRWYQREASEKNPFLTLINLDWPWSFALTRQQHDEQQELLEAGLVKPRTTPFLALRHSHPCTAVDTIAPTQS